MDVEQFKKTFLPFYPKLFRIACALTGNKNEAEDLVQDVYYKLWSKRGELAALRNPEAFCITLVKNAGIDRLRMLPEERKNVEITKSALYTVVPSPEQHLEMREQLDVVHRLIDLLPENQRLVLRLRGIEDCSLEEIGQITGYTPSNIRVLLSRARKFLREKMDVCKC